MYLLGPCEVVQLLIDKGANVDAVADENKSALQYAILSLFFATYFQKPDNS